MTKVLTTCKRLPTVLLGNMGHQMTINQKKFVALVVLWLIGIATLTSGATQGYIDIGREPILVQAIGFGIFTSTTALIIAIAIVYLFKHFGEA